GTEYFHRHVGAMPIHGLACLGIAHAVWRLLTQAAGQNVESLGAGMGMYRRLGLRGAAGMIDAQEILWGTDRGDGAYLRHPGSADCASAFPAERKEPTLAGTFGGQRRLACSGLRLGESREILDPPEQGPGRQLLELLFRDVPDLEFLLRLCVR